MFTIIITYSVIRRKTFSEKIRNFPEDGGSVSFRNVDIYLQDHTILQFKDQHQHSYLYLLRLNMGATH